MSQWARENPELVGTDADPWMANPIHRKVTEQMIREGLMYNESAEREREELAPESDLVATQGRADCTNPGCRRRYAPGDPPEGICVGYHCSKCGEPTGMMGHRCQLVPENDGKAA